MSRFLHMVNFRERDLESKGPPDRILEDPPPGNLAPPGDLEESASRHSSSVKRLTRDSFSVSFTRDAIRSSVFAPRAVVRGS